MDSIIQPGVAAWTRSIRPSQIQDCMMMQNQNDFMSFAVGLPDCSIINSKIIEDSSVDLMTSNPFALQYGSPELSLKRHVVEIMRMRGVCCKEDDIFLTSGGQQGIDLMLKLLLGFDGNIAAEKYTYSGFLQAMLPYQQKILAVNTCYQSGLDIESLELVAKENLSALYTVADGGNPHGASISNEKRLRLVELAKQRGFTIIEDDPYGLLYYDETRPSLKSLGGENVCYIGSFSKIIAPAFRAGWVVVPAYLREPLTIMKEGTDVNTSCYSHRLLVNVLDRVCLHTHLSLLRSIYKERRDVLVDSIQRYFPVRVSFEIPRSGFFLWIRFPGEFDVNALLKICLHKYKVGFISGSNFCVQSRCPDEGYVRLCFSSNKIEDIREGVRRMASAINYVINS